MPNDSELARIDGTPEEIRLSGDFLLSLPRPDVEMVVKLLKEGTGRVKILDDGIRAWDSTLMTLILRLDEESRQSDRELVLADLPEGVHRLLELSKAVPPPEASPQSKTRTGMLAAVGTRAQNAWSEAGVFAAFIGEVTLAFSRLVRGKSRFRMLDVWLQLEACGPQALGIVSLISVLVGAILAFVGAEQLSMFNAEIFVANLVGLGMVMEMGALMTGIILAGRTGAAFAAQLGTMQVNEEVDALKTLGIPPVDYLVLPRMIALAVMTPLLVIYANALGILGGTAVGVLLLDIPLKVFFMKTFEMMTPWLCIQGLIKGSTFGILVALAGCLRGMQCGRSASAVGQAATSAVVTSLILIVIADACWTLIFMTGP